jgi:hypothetical protein
MVIFCSDITDGVAFMVTVFGDDEQRQPLAAPQWSLTIGIVAGGTTTTERA